MMTLKSLALLIPLLILLSCGSGDSAESSQSKAANFSITGKVVGAAETQILLEAMSPNGTIKVAETTSNSSGEFELKGNIPGLGIYQLRIGQTQDKVVPMTLSPQETVSVNANLSDFATNPKLSGPEWTSPMNHYLKLFGGFFEGQMQLNTQRDRLTEDELTNEYLKLRKPIDDFAIKQMNKDPDNPVNIVLLNSATPATGFENWDVKNLDLLKKVAEAYKKKYNDSPIASTMENQAFQIESAYNEYLQSLNGSSSSQLAPEISMKDPIGKVRKLSSLRGKYVLIDFWASWCGPCRRESPNVVKMYKQYKDKGFAVFSVSLDNNAAAWKQAITADGLIWADHVCDLMGWDTPMTQLYGFNSIPHTVLVDKEGKILATGLRGEDLEQKLKELMPN
jgi:thiol-disulfide isomerase/thioredoxin